MSGNAYGPLFSPLKGRFRALICATCRTVVGRSPALLVPIGWPETCRSRWPARHLTFAYTGTRPYSVSYDGPV